MKWVRLEDYESLKALLREWIEYERSESKWHNNPELTEKTRAMIGEDME